MFLTYLANKINYLNPEDLIYPQIFTAKVHSSWTISFEERCPLVFLLLSYSYEVLQISRHFDHFDGAFPMPIVWKPLIFDARVLFGKTRCRIHKTS